MGVLDLISLFEGINNFQSTQCTVDPSATGQRMEKKKGSFTASLTSIFWKTDSVPVDCAGYGRPDDKMPRSDNQGVQGSFDKGISFPTDNRLQRKGSYDSKLESDLKVPRNIIPHDEQEHNNKTARHGMKNRPGFSRGGSLDKIREKWERETTLFTSGSIQKSKSIEIEHASRNETDTSSSQRNLGSHQIGLTKAEELLQQRRNCQSLKNIAFLCGPSFDERDESEMKKMPAVVSGEVKATSENPKDEVSNKHNKLKVDSMSSGKELKQESLEKINGSPEDTGLHTGSAIRLNEEPLEKEKEDYTGEKSSWESISKTGEQNSLHDRMSSENVPGTDAHSAASSSVLFSSSRRDLDSKDDDMQNFVHGRQPYAKERSKSEPAYIYKGSRLTKNYRTYTVGNIISVNDSDVSVSVNDCLSGSRDSLLSSSSAEIRNCIAEKTEAVLRDLPGEFVETKAYRQANKILRENNFVIILSAEGSGSSMLALTMLKRWRCQEKYMVSDYGEFHVCARSQAIKSIFADDPLGDFRLKENDVDLWLRQFENSRSSKTQLIFTLKHHIASQFKEKLAKFKNFTVDIESPKYCLTSNKMCDIGKAIIKNNEKLLKVRLSDIRNGQREAESKRQCKRYRYLSEEDLNAIASTALPTGFPKRFFTFLENKQLFHQGVSYFAYPKELADKVMSLKNSDGEEDIDRYVALVALSLANGRLDHSGIKAFENEKNDAETKLTKSISTSKKKRRKYRSKEIRETNNACWRWNVLNHFERKSKAPLKEIIIKGLTYLQENLVIKETSFYRFRAKCVKIAVLASWGIDFPELVLKACDTFAFQVLLKSNNSHNSQPWEGSILTLNTQEADTCCDAMQFVRESIEKGDVKTLSQNVLLRDSTFLEHILRELEHDRESWWKLCTTPDSRSGQDLLRCLFPSRHSQLLSQTLSDTLPYKLLTSSAWDLIRKLHTLQAEELELEVLKYCCHTGNIDIYKSLRSTKVSSHICLFIAIKSGCFPIVEYILKKIGRTMEETEKCSAMKCALLHYTEDQTSQRRNIVEALRNLTTVDYKGSVQEPYIIQAAISGNAKMINTLNDFNGDINVTDSNRRTCLHVAVKLNKPYFLQEALNKGADQRRQNKKGLLPIHQAVKLDNNHITKLLVDKDRSIATTPDLRGRHPLHFAAKHNSVNTARFLLDVVKNVDTLDDDHKTPVHYAVESGKGGVLHFLLERNANTNVTNYGGKSLLYEACREGNIQAVRCILKHSLNTDIIDPECLFVTSKEGNLKIFKLLLEKGADLAALTPDTRNTVLHIATYQGHKQLVCFIIQKDGDDGLKSHRNRDGETPLHLAARKGDPDLVRTLLSYGSERSPINKHGQTPLTLVEHRLQQEPGLENFLSVARLLKNNGAEYYLETPV